MAEIKSVTEEGHHEVQKNPHIAEEAFPTDEELRSLRRVPGTLPWPMFSVAFVELCERFSYAGTVAVFVNFIQRPLPAGSTTGAVHDNSVPGALGMGQRASTGLILCRLAVSMDGRMANDSQLLLVLPDAAVWRVRGRSVSWSFPDHHMGYCCGHARA